MLKSWLKKKLSPFFRNSWVLMYHRVDNPDIDPWSNAVTKEKFEEQLAWLKQHRNIQPLADVVNDWKNGKLKKRSIAFSFDDAYFDNYTTVLPLLEKYEIPATFFICTNSIFNNEPYWWDQLQAYILESPSLPKNFSVRIGLETIEIDLETERELTQQLKAKIKQWRYPQPPYTKRGELYLVLWRELRKLNEIERKEAMKKLRDLSGNTQDTELRTFTQDHLKEVSKHPLISIGAHSVSHPAFQFLPAQDQWQEMVDCKKRLEVFLNKPVPHFAFPYGSYNNESFALAERAGFEASFITQSIAINKCRNPHFLGRVMMTNDLDFKVALR